jgi:hypothetical protein
MSAEKLEARVAALEAAVERLRAKVDESGTDKVPWWKAISGTFQNDPAYAEAMRLGRKYRESTRPKPRKKRKSGHGGA